MKKRILSLLLCMMLCLSVLPMSAFAQELPSMQNVKINPQGNLSWDSVSGAAGYYVGIKSGETIRGENFAQLGVSLKYLCNQYSSICDHTGDYTVLLYAWDSHADRITEIWTGTYHFVKETSYTVTYNRNGGSGTMASQQLSPNNEGIAIYSFPACGFTAPTGKKFDHWEVVGDNREFSKGTQLAITSDVTVKPVWVDGEEDTVIYTVTYDRNGGSGTMLSEQLSPNNEGIAIYSFPACGFTAPTGKKFDHWEVVGDNRTFSKGTQLAIFGDVTVKPIWVADDGPSNEPHTVSFIMNGHGTSIIAQTVAHGATANKPADPSETGWTFEGWYADASFNAPFNFNTAITAPMTLYAKWTQDSSTPSEAKLTLSVTSSPAAGTPVTIGQHVSHYYTVKNTGSEPVLLDGIYKGGARILQYMDTTLAPGASHSWGESGFYVAEANITQNAQGEKGVMDSFHAAGFANGVAVNSNTVTDWHPLKTSDNPTPTPDKPNTPTNPPKDNLDNSPKTGDARQTVLWIGMLMVSFGTAAAAVQISRKKDQV